MGVGWCVGVYVSWCVGVCVNWCVVCFEILVPGTNPQLLVTSNDSRVRLYNLKEHELSCKYKGYLNSNSQIKATFSRDGQYIISGSEDNFIYIWKTHQDLNKLSSTRRDRNEFYESFSGKATRDIDRN